MLKLYFTLSALALLAACSDPRSTIIPSDLDKLADIQPQIQKLTEEERTLLGAYMVRRTMKGGMLGKMAGDTGTGPTTIAQALDNQRAFVAAKQKEEAEAAALQAKMKAEREAAMEAMRKVVTVAIISKKIEVERGYSGMELDRHFTMSVGYKNNGEKDISGVKGLLVVKDLFGDTLSEFAISNDDTIKAGGTAVWRGSRSIKFPRGDNKDEKLADLPDDKFKVEWLPRAVVFTDGSKLSAPE